VMLSHAQAAADEMVAGDAVTRRHVGERRLRTTPRRRRVEAADIGRCVELRSAVGTDRFGSQQASEFLFRGRFKLGWKRVQAAVAGVQVAGGSGRRQPPVSGTRGSRQETGGRRWLGFYHRKEWL